MHEFEKAERLAASGIDVRRAVVFSNTSSFTREFLTRIPLPERDRLIARQAGELLTEMILSRRADMGSLYLEAEQISDSRRDSEAIEVKLWANDRGYAQQALEAERRRVEEAQSEILRRPSKFERSLGQFGEQAIES